ncbi:hypothetical protein MMPV_008042 [Pyropia vietnamensis]
MNKHSISFLLNEPPTGAGPTIAAAAHAAAPADDLTALWPVDGLCGSTTPANGWNSDTVSDLASCIPSSEASEARPVPAVHSRLSPPPLLTSAPLTAPPPTSDALALRQHTAGIWLPLLPAPLASLAVAGDLPISVRRVLCGGWAPPDNPLSSPPISMIRTDAPAGSLSTTSSMSGGITSLVSTAPSAQVEAASSTSGDRAAAATPVARAPVALAPAVASAVPSAATTGEAAAEALSGTGRSGTHQCPSCSVWFRRLGDLRKHLSCVHTFPRRHACEYCGRRFGERSNMIKHVAALHLKRRDAVCGQCNKAFAFSDGLARHVRLVHGGERRYVCGECGGRFKQRTHLQKHMAGVHKIARPPTARKAT